jgi:hypothetical protein
MTSKSEEQTNSIWLTPGINERMQELLLGTDTTAEVACKLADEFSIRVTKNMVIGRSKREGIKSAKFVGRPRKPEGQLAQKPPRIRAKPDKPRVTGSEVSLEHLKTNDCRWLLTDRDPWVYCGHKQVEGHSYCEQHCEESYPNWKRMT